MKLSLYVLTDGLSPSLHRRLLQAEMKLDEGVIEMREIHHHQRFAVEVVKALQAALETMNGIPKPMLIATVERGNRSCVHCGGAEFHQPYGFSTTIECNRCGAQCEGGAALANG